MAYINEIYTIRIYLQDLYTPNSSIGLYTISGLSELRYAETFVTGFDSFMPDYNSDYTGRNSFGEIKHGSDLRQGGNKAFVSEAFLSLSNINDLDNSLKNLGIDLIGKIVEISSNVLTYNTSGVLTGVASEKKFYGEIKEWSIYREKNDLKLKGVSEKRNADMSFEITKEEYPNSNNADINKTIPIVWGRFLNSDERYIKYIRLESEPIEYIENNSSNKIDFDNYYVRTDFGNKFLNILPVYSYDSSATPPTISLNLVVKNKKVKTNFTNTTYTLAWHTSGGTPVYSSTITLNGLAGQWVKIVKGDGLNHYAKITSASVNVRNNINDYRNGIININLSEVFIESPAASTTHDAQNQSSAKIVFINKTFICDKKDTKGYAIGESVAGLDFYDLFALKEIGDESKEEKYLYLDNIDKQTQTAYNKLNLNNLTLDDSGQVSLVSCRASNYVKAYDPFEYEQSDYNGFKTLGSFEPYFYSDPLNDWDRYLHYSSSGKKVYVQNKSEEALTPIILVVSRTGLYSNATDGNYSTSQETDISFSTGAEKTGVIEVIEFDMPLIDENTYFDNIYLAVDMETNFGTSFKEMSFDNTFPQMNNGATAIFGYRNSYGGLIQIGSFDLDESLWVAHYKNIPDNYWNIPANTYNRNFKTTSSYLTTTTSTNDTRVFSGFKNYKLADINTLEKYENIFKGYIMFGADSTKPNVVSPFVFKNKLIQVGILFETVVDIDKEIYSPGFGRVTGDTWDGRWLLDGFIDNPLSVIEYCIRSQNWSEKGGTEPSRGWGKEFYSTPLIDTNKFPTQSGVVVSDEELQNKVATTQISKQITNNSDMTTYKIISSICKEMFLVQYVDKDGVEDVKYLLSKETPTKTITREDCIEIGSVIEPDERYIYCEPVINYAYDNGTNTYKKQITVRNVSTGSFSADYVSGVTSLAEKELIYNKCSDIYKKFTVYNKPPSNWSNLNWIYKESDAITCLYNKLYWMTRSRLTIKMKYDTGKSIYCYDFVNVNMPEINLTSKKCFIEESKESKKNNYIEFKLVILDDTEIVDDRWKNSTNETTYPNYENSTDAVTYDNYKGRV